MTLREQRGLSPRSSSDIVELSRRTVNAPMEEVEVEEVHQWTAAGSEIADVVVGVAAAVVAVASTDEEKEKK